MSLRDQLLRDYNDYMRFVVFLLCLSSLVACTTPMVERFDKVELGMDKTDVIDEVGSPNRSLRSNDQDIWIYTFHTPDTIEQREVCFKDNVVSYVGTPRPRNEHPKIKSEEEAAAVLKKELK